MSMSIGPFRFDIRVINIKPVLSVLNVDKGVSHLLSLLLKKLRSGLIYPFQ